MKKYSLQIIGIMLLIIFIIPLMSFSQNSVDPIVLSIQEKLNQKHVTVLQEFEQLKQISQTDPKAVLSIADSNKDARIRRISLLSVDQSNDPGLENMLLEKWDKWAGEDDALFLSSMRILGKRGSNNTIQKCIRELENGNQLQRTGALTALTWMQKTHPSLETRIMANETMEHARIRGEQIKDPELCLLSDVDLLQKSLNAPNKFQERYYLHEIGERALLGLLDFNSPDIKKSLDEIINKQFQNLESPQREAQSGASENIQRLWRLCAPGLIKRIGHENLSVYDAASRNLALMRDRDIIEQIIEKCKTSNNIEEKKRGIITLGSMKDKAWCMIRGREVMGEEESVRLVLALIIPYLNLEKGKDMRPEIQGVIQSALDHLSNPHDLRPQPLSIKPMKMW